MTTCQFQPTKGVGGALSKSEEMPFLPETFQVHGGTIIIMICAIKFFVVKTWGVSKDSHRDEICAEVVRLITQERKRQGISGNVLAERAGLSQSLISSLETNPWNPTLDTLLRIGEVLNIDVGELISKAGSTQRKK